MANIVLSPYKVTWVEFRAQKGIVTKHDEKILAKYFPNKHYRNGDRIHVWFGSQDAATSYLQLKDFSHLKKRYEVRMCNDKQFGMAISLRRTTYIRFTKKQEAEMYVI